MQSKLPTHKVEKINHLEAGKRIRKLREKYNMSLRKMANLMDISAPFLSDLELGRRNWSRDRYELAMRILIRESN